jgi:uncharacterized membrane protein YjjP (DUF1212 family)
VPEHPLTLNEEARQSVEIALDAALIVMRNGGSTFAAERSFNNILAGFKTEGVSATWRLDSIAATGAVEGRSFVVVRSVGAIGVNLVRVAAVAALGERVARGEMALAALGPELARIRAMPSPYNRWSTTPAAACVGAAFSQFAGGDVGALGVAFVAAGMGQVLRSFLQERKHPVARVTLVCGLLSACIASVGLRLGFTHGRR